MLAHGEYGEPRRGFQGRAVIFSHFRSLRCLAQHEAQSALHAGVGKFGQRARYALQRPNTGDVGQRDGKRGSTLGDAQPRHGIGLCFGIGRRQCERRRIGKGRFRPIVEKGFQHCMFAQSEPREERAVAERTRKNRTLRFGRHKTFRFQRSEGALGASSIKGCWRRCAVECGHGGSLVENRSREISGFAANGGENG